MKKIIIFILFATIYSCKVKQQETYVNYGSFKAKGKDYNHELVLNSNNTFIIIFKHFEVSSKCSGSWVYDSKDTIVLTCSKTQDISETLQGGYLNERVMSLKIEDRNNIVFKNIPFKRLEGNVP